MLRSSLYLLYFTMPQKISYTILTPRTGFVAYFTELNDIKSTIFFTDFAVLEAEEETKELPISPGTLWVVRFLARTLWVVLAVTVFSLPAHPPKGGRLL